MSWSNFNDAEDQQDVIPGGTLAKVHMQICLGHFDDPNMGWTGGYATRNEETGACYLDCEFTVMEGPFAKRKVWSLIGLHSPKGEKWAQMGRAMVKAILNSARGISAKDNSPQAQTARQISGFADLDGIEFVARIDVEEDTRGIKNKISKAITPDHKEYTALMKGAGGIPTAQWGNNNGGTPPAPATPAAPPVTPTPTAPAAPAQPVAQSTRPSWAQ